MPLSTSDVLSQVLGNRNDVVLPSLVLAGEHPHLDVRIVVHCNVLMEAAAGAAGCIKCCSGGRLRGCDARRLTAAHYFGISAESCGVAVGRRYRPVCVGLGAL